MEEAAFVKRLAWASAAVWEHQTQMPPESLRLLAYLLLRDLLKLP